MSRLSDFMRVCEGISRVVHASTKFRPGPGLSSSAPPFPSSSSSHSSSSSSSTFRAQLHTSKYSLWSPVQTIMDTVSEFASHGAPGAASGGGGNVDHHHHMQQQQQGEMSNVFVNRYRVPFDTPQQQHHHHQQQQHQEKASLRSSPSPAHQGERLQGTVAPVSADDTAHRHRHQHHHQQQQEEEKEKVETGRHSMNNSSSMSNNNSIPSVSSSSSEEEHRPITTATATTAHASDVDDAADALYSIHSMSGGDGPVRVFRERSIPSTPLSRMVGFSSLGLQLAYGTAKQWVRNKFASRGEGQSSEPSTADAAAPVSVVDNDNDNDDVEISGGSGSGSGVDHMAKKAETETEQQQQQQQHHRQEEMRHNASTSTAASASTADSSSGRRSALKSAMLTDDNADRLAATLCRMRGAALKLGQMLSMQDESFIPEPFLRALERVRNQADIMPRRQLERQLQSELGAGWKSKYFSEFDMNPIAAASIGQVHRAVLLDGTVVAVKVQYPGVSESIDSDIKNLMRLIQFTGLVPQGAFLGNTMNQARRELMMECDYTIEASNQRRFRQLLEDSGMHEHMVVPRVFDHVSTRRVLVTEMIPSGSKTIEQLSDTAPLEVRNRVARLLLDLCLRELFVFRFMQTDPNWSNFYYNDSTGKLYLLDFGACLEFPKSFIDEYIRVVAASSTRDKATIIDASRKMGFLTGEETALMNDAHAEAALTVGEPFATPGVYNFEDRAMTKRVKEVIPTMLKHRLTAPPPVSYSLHRKLSGSFLLCFKLRAQIECRSLFVDIAREYRFDNDEYKLHV